ncbi:MAG: carotenoid oxygenase family protein [Acidimicrobiia bacterium]|nr:carotenoid oxygenase family protein [Acidimicrobiia bacterium]
MSDATRYLADNLAPVTEEITAFELEVEGTLPDCLDGRYLRNGPNPLGPIDPAKHHWFVGEGMVHGIRLRDGRAEWYRNRWVRTAEVAAALGEAPPPNHLAADRPVFSANTNVIGIAGRTFAIVEAGAVPVELDDELATVGPSDFDGTLPWGFSAHPKVDPATGKLHAVAYWWGWGNKVQYVVVGADGRVERHRDVSMVHDLSPMMHDLSITETRAVLYDLPCHFDLDAAMSGHRLPYRWKPEVGARVGLLPLDGSGDPTWIEVDPCYVFHPLNAWDEPDGRLVADVVRHPRMFATDVHGPNEGAPTLQRWTIDPVAGTVREECLDDRPQEFPRVDERRVGRRHRFGYSVALGNAWSHGGLVRHDNDRNTSELIDHGAGRATMEPVFVPRHDGAAEDDGWIMALVHDATAGRAELVLLDASAPGEGPVARVKLPARVPFGFHGNWIPSIG